MIKLRHYQTKLQRDIRSALSRHRSVLAVSPTGSGKTVTFSDILRQAHQANHRSYVAVHRDELVQQISDTLGKFDVPHGLISSRRHPDLRHNIQVCSIGTLANRTDIISSPKLMIFDEAHHCTAGQYQKIMSAYRCKTIGFTATPERLDGEPLGDAFDELVLGPSIRSLIAEGSLKQPVYHIVPSSLTREAIRKAGKDYSRDALTAATLEAKGESGGSIFGDAVKHYSQRTPGLPCLVFTSSIQVAEKVCEWFVAAGWRFATLHGGLSAHDRRERVLGLATGKYHGLVTVDLVSEGFDVPACCVIIMLRKTMSLSLYMQQGGRGLRPYLDHEFAHIFDHVGNFDMHGRLEDDRAWSLGTKIDRSSERILTDRRAQVRECVNCGAAHDPAPRCPVCGHQYQVKDRDVRFVEGELVELSPVTGQPVLDKWMRCECGFIHEKGRGKCPSCNKDHDKELRLKKRKQEFACKTLAELIRLARDRGYNHPEAWANRRWRDIRGRKTGSNQNQLQLL